MDTEPRSYRLHQGTAPLLVSLPHDGTRIPAEVAFAVADGAHPVRAWREHRGLSQDALAADSGLSKPFVSQIEGGKRAGTTTTLKKLAAALQVPLAALT